MFEDGRVYGGSKQFLPLRINQAGVMPIIFASSLLMPGVICGGLATLFAGRSDFWASIFGSLSSMFQVEPPLCTTSSTWL